MALDTGVCYQIDYTWSISDHYSLVIKHRMGVDMWPRWLWLKTSKEGSETVRDVAWKRGWPSTIDEWSQSVCKWLEKSMDIPFPPRSSVHASLPARASSSPSLWFARTRAAKGLCVP